MKKIILFLMIFLSVPNIAFANFGRSCSNVDESIMSSDIITSLESKTMFGFVKKLIDIENCGEGYLGNCSASLSGGLPVCVRNAQSVDQVANASNSVTTTMQMNSTIRLGDLTPHPAVSADWNLANLNISFTMVGDKPCVVMPTTYGYAPLVCLNSSTNQASQTRDMSQCSEVSNSCSLYNNPQNPSRTYNSFFGNAIECVYESLDIIFFDPRTCDRFDESIMLNGGAKETKVKPFAEFYATMKLSVTAALTLYMIFIGIKMMLEHQEVTAQDLFFSVIKMLLVIYFSVGTTAIDFFSGKEKHKNGITELVLPMMVSFSSGMSSYIFNNASSNYLCYFSPHEYDSKHSYYALWDSLDCRMNVYLGSSKVFHQDKSDYTRVNMPDEPRSTVPNIGYDWGNRPDALKVASDDNIAMRTAKDILASEETRAIAFFVVIFAFLIAGGLLPFIILIFVMLVVIGLMFSVVMSFLVSMVILYILAYVAPIFVPMSLFERTKTFFDSWLNLCLSSTLQPVIILAFSAFIFNLIDSFMFDQCIFAKYTRPGTSSFFFELRLPFSGDGAACKGSIGYKLFQYYQLSPGWKQQTFLFFKTVSLKDVYDLEGSCWTGLIMCFFLKYLLEQVYSLSSALSGGMSLDSVVSSPMAIINAIKSMVKRTQQQGNLAKDMMQDEKQGSGDSVRSVGK